MADQTATLEFTLENFESLFKNSVIKQYLSRMEIQQIEEALEEKDTPVLSALFEIFKRHKVADEKTVRDFVMANARLQQQLSVEVTGVEKEAVMAPIKAAAKATASKDSEEADEMIRKL